MASVAHQFVGDGHVIFHGILADAVCFLLPHLLCLLCGSDVFDFEVALYMHFVITLDGR